MFKEWARPSHSGARGPPTAIAYVLTTSSLAFTWALWPARGQEVRTAAPSAPPSLVKPSSCGPRRLPGHLCCPLQCGSWRRRGHTPHQASERPALAFTPANPSVWDRFQRTTPALSTFLILCHLHLQSFTSILLSKIGPLISTSVKQV